MTIWSAEIKELETLFTSIKDRFPELEKELEQLIKTKDANVVMLYSRRCLEVIITDLCECKLKRPRKTEPLKGIIDKLHHEEKIPSHIIASMQNLNTLSTFGAHPKEFDPEQVKPVLINLDIIIKWYLKYKDFNINDKPKSEGKRFESKQPPEKSLIVLPFVNISPDPDQEYFSDGLTEEIITDLSHIHDLIVISRSSAMTFKGTKKKIGEIAKEVNVQYVLEGSVRKAGNNLRIIAQLIDGTNDSHIWAEKYSGILDDIFEIQEQVSRSIVSALKVKLSPEERRNISQRPIDNLEAYEYYLKARQEIYRFSEEGLDRALQYLRKGLEITGDNLLLYSCMGNVNFQYWNMEISLDESYIIKARNYAELIFQIKPDSHYGRLISGLLNSGTNPREAIKEFKIVLKDDPYNDDALLWLCFLNAFFVKTNQIDPLNERLIKTDPFNSIVKIIPGLSLYFQGESDRARESIKKSCQSDKNDIVVLFHYGRIQAACGLIEEALSAFDTVVEKCNLCPGILSRLYGFALRGQKQEILKVLNPDIKKWALSDFVFSLFIAECLAIVRDPYDAMEWLEHSVNLGFINYPYLNEYCVFLKSIRSEERFEKLMVRVKYEWENFEV